MRRPRVHLPGATGPGPITVPGEQARRLGAVLRLRAGDEFLAFPGDGREWLARVVASARGNVAAEVVELARQGAPSPLVLEVCCGLIRPARFDWAVEKCTEAGADVIRPLISEHAARGERPSPARLERWQRIAVEAAEQSGRLFVPAVAGPVTFDGLLSGQGATWVCDETGSPISEHPPPASGRLTLAIGPEGGFSPAEVAHAGRVTVVSLGGNILRTETAAVAATILVRALSDGEHGRQGT